MIKTDRRRALGAAIPLVLSAVLALPGSAAAGVETVQRTVSYRDLDLSRPEGVARLQTRIDLAVSRLCGPITASPFEVRIGYRDCVERAKAGAQQQVAEAVRAARNPSALAQAEP